MDFKLFSQTLFNDARISIAQVRAVTQKIYTKYEIIEIFPSLIFSLCPRVRTKTFRFDLI